MPKTVKCPKCEADRYIVDCGSCGATICHECGTIIKPPCPPECHGLPDKEDCPEDCNHLLPKEEENGDKTYSIKRAGLPFNIPTETERKSTTITLVDNPRWNYEGNPRWKWEGTMVIYDNEGGLNENATRQVDNVVKKREAVEKILELKKWIQEVCYYQEEALEKCEDCRKIDCPNYGLPGGGQAVHGTQREAAAASSPNSIPGVGGSSAQETHEAPQTPGGLHIPTLIKLKEIIDSDEELHQCIASGDGWSIIDGILERLIKSPAAVTEEGLQVAEHREETLPETRKGDEAAQGGAIGPLIPPASADTAGDLIVCGDDSEPCDFRAYAGLEETFCKRKKGVCKHQVEMKK